MRKRKEEAERKRMDVVPGSEEDMKLYLQARAVDELFKELDTVNRQANIAKANRETVL